MPALRLQLCRKLKITTIRSRICHFTRWQPLLKSLTVLFCFASAPNSKVSAATTFNLVTYNLENYLLTPTASRSAKAQASRLKVHEILAAVRPDVLAVQEIGETNALLDLQKGLAAMGIVLPYWEHVRGYDTNIFVAVLSRFPIVERRSHTNLTFLLGGRRFRSSRGVVEVDLQVSPAYRFTLISTHLKSRRPIGAADEAEMREQEAIKLHEVVERVLEQNTRANVVVCGDFNDIRDSRPLKHVLGEGARSLIDARPLERDFRCPPADLKPPDVRAVTWTYFYAREDSYSRIDYILMSRGIAREWQRDRSFVLAHPDWGQASDHRPVVATFVAEEK